MRSVTYKSFMLSVIMMNIAMLSVAVPFQTVRRCPGSTVVEQWPLNPKIGGSNPDPCTWRE